MRESVVPEALVDALAVVGFLSGESLVTAPDSVRRPVAFGEVHLFTYLGCLLSLYRRQPTASWGYLFVRTDSGLPFASPVSVALDSLARSGLVEHSADEGLFLTNRGRESLHQFGTFDLMRYRVDVIRAACDAAITIPPTVIRQAMSAEPGLSLAANRALHTTLGSEGSRETLYNQFKTLHRVLGMEAGNLLIPAMAWLTYLSETVTATMDVTPSPH